MPEAAREPESSAPGSSRPSAAPDLGRGALALGLLLAGSLCVLGYRPALEGDFVLDDFAELVDNPAVRDLGRFAQPDGWRPLAARPLTLLSFAIQYRLGGLRPFGFHAASLALHLATGLLLFLLGRRLLEAIGAWRPRAVALVAAGAFLLHPLQTETVAYVAQRAEGLAALLTASALLLLLAGIDRGPTARGAALLAAGAAAFLLGLAAKPTAAVVPLLFVLCAGLFPAGTPAGAAARLRRLWPAIPLAAVSVWAAVAGLRAVAGSSHAGLDAPFAAPGDQLLTQARVVWRYLALLAWPAGQSFDPDVRRTTSIADPAALAAVAGLLALLATAAAALRRPPATDGARAARVAAFGLLWFLAALLPSSAVPLADPMAEHRVYLATSGVALATAAAVELALRWAPPRATLGAALAVWLALGAALHERSSVWASNVALWSDTVRQSPEKGRPHASLAEALIARGRTAEAIPELLQAIRAGGPTLFDAGVHGDLAIALFKAQRLDDAQAEAERSIAAEPTRGAPYNTLGLVLEAKGDLVAALSYFRRTTELSPVEPVGWLNLARALERLGDPSACEAWARHADALADAESARSVRAHREALGCR
jgi:tetratricopeptide (TPR) repeat protein